MKDKYIHNILIPSFLILLTIFLIVQNVSRPRVLVLHSYYTDFSWVRDINVGLLRGLGNNSYQIRWHYMDTKRHPSNDFKMRAGVTARKMIDSWQPDVIVAIDDNAQEYVAKYYLNHPRIKIVFTGVNKTEQDYGYDKATNVTGVLERINYQATKDILLQVLPPDKRRIIHISDDSNTSEGIHDEITAFDWSPLKFQDSILCATFENWKKAIKEAEGKADFILFTHYHTLLRDAQSDEVMQPKVVIDWTKSHSKTPGLSFWGFYVEDGGMMAIALSPYEQGEEAGKMVVGIIEHHISPADISTYVSRLFVIYMRASELENKLGKLGMPLVYEAFARATNTYYE